MKMSGGPASANIKISLLVLAVAIAISTLIYTQTLVDDFRERERQVAELYAKSLEFILGPESDNVNFSFIFQNIVSHDELINFPLITTDENDKIPLIGIGLNIKNLEIDSTLSDEEKMEFLNNKVIELGKIHSPIVKPRGVDGVIQKIYYGDSNIVTQLRFYPFIQILIALAFISVAYFSFSYMKRNEESNIWVGMAKEAAHQLGTPISSLMGWHEMLKLNFNNPSKVQDTASEIHSDLNRLNKIVLRFSKIGSKPELKQENIYQVISRVIHYFQRRLPHTGKNVDIKISGDKESLILLNAELFEWVIENLIKNGLDAIEDKAGIISFELTKTNKGIEIECSDNGKGIDLKRRKDIFRPGYSTKRRGWGLGLSLSRRIVENYHNGKIIVKNSALNEGTTFKISLP